jgi:hypothetical protein
LSSWIISTKLEMHGSGDVARGKYDNMEVEALRGNFARKSYNNNSGITQWQ